MESMPLIAEPLWRTHPDQIRDSNMAQFREWLRENRSLDFRDHHALYDWSVRDLADFWSAIAEFFHVRFHTSPERVLQLDPDAIRTKWFPGGTLNYAEHLLRCGRSEVGLSDDRPAVLYCAERGVPGNRQVLSRTELVHRVQQLTIALQRLGVQCEIDAIYRLATQRRIHDRGRERLGDRIAGNSVHSRRRIDLFDSVGAA